MNDCPLRYILDRSVSDQCLELVLDEKSLVDFDGRLFRLPDRQLWIEWISDPPYSEAPNLRSGILVDCEENGRRGRISTFIEDLHGRAELIPANIIFDLDEEMAAPHGCDTIFQLRHGAMPGLDRVFRHFLFDVDASWARFIKVQRGSQAAAAIHDLAESTWFGLPFLLAFSALLNTQGVLDQRSSNLARLNRARRRRGRTELLDHIEVGFSLSHAAGATSGQEWRGGHRRPCRLHHVRGHLVHRSGKIFWRAPHLRGDPERVIASKTVRVRA
jgi:hypothetical protein